MDVGQLILEYSFGREGGELGDGEDLDWAVFTGMRAPAVADGERSRECDQNWGLDSSEKWV